MHYIIINPFFTNLNINRVSFLIKNRSPLLLVFINKRQWWAPRISLFLIAKDSTRESFLVTSRFSFQMEIADYPLNDSGFHDFIPHDFLFISSNTIVSLIYTTSFVNLQLCKFKCKLTLNNIAYAYVARNNKCRTRTRFHLICRPHFSASVKRFLLRCARSNCIPTIHVFPNDLAQSSYEAMYRVWFMSLINLKGPRSVETSGNPSCSPDTRDCKPLAGNSTRKRHWKSNVKKIL